MKKGSLHRRRTPRFAAIPIAGFAVLAFSLVACAAREGPHHSLVPMWREYEKMPEERAFAVAGNPERVWVGAIGGGYATREIAEENVLAECTQRRAARRLQDPCRLYATGDEIVW